MAIGGRFFSPMWSKKTLVAAALGKSGLRALLARLSRWSGLLCLNYHRIGDSRRSLFDRELWSATAADFEAQVRFLKQHFDVVGPDDLAHVLGKRCGRHALLTFDDGYRDNYALAFPILETHGIRAAFFVTSSFLDRSRPACWDEIAWMVRTSPRRRIPGATWLAHDLVFDEPEREQAVRTLVARYKELPLHEVEPYLDFLAEATGSGRCPPTETRETWMTWDMVRELREAGMSIGGHTVNHLVLAQLSPEQQWEEIHGCAKRLEVELGEPMTLFSYPFGSAQEFDEATRTCLRRQGVRLAFSFYGRYWNFDRPREWDCYNVPRLALDQAAGLDVFRARTTLPDLFR